MPRTPTTNQAVEVTDKPTSLQGTWAGYYNKKDKTIITPNALIAGTVNCLIPDNDFITTRKGSYVLGQEATYNDRIIGHKKKFTNGYGLDLEVRVWQSGDANRKDIFEVYYENSLTGVAKWWQFSENVNPIAAAVSRLGMTPHYYFSEWFDVNIDTSQSLQLSRLIGVNGGSNIISWTGGIAEITGLTGTTLSVDASLTWKELGFAEDGSGNINVVVNGVAYTATGGLTTNTLTGITSTAGISINDVAFQQMELDASPMSFDHCSTTKNHVQYGNFGSRQLYGSNAFNRPATQRITASQVAEDNDLILDQASPYTGTGSHVYRITIDSAAINDATFDGSGSDSVIFDKSAYVGTGNNTYKVIVYKTTNAIQNSITYALTGGPFYDGETISNGTGTTATVRYDDQAGNLLIDPASLPPLTTFLPGETITGVTSGSTATVMGFVHDPKSFGGFYYVAFKNGVQVNFGPLHNPGGDPVTGPFAISDGLTFDIPTTVIGYCFPEGGTAGPFLTYTGSLNNGDSWELKIGTYDTYQYQIDGGAPIGGTMNPITAGATISLTDGIDISFVSQVGHTVGDYWEITVNQEITRGWANFYYTVPTRSPGEGFLVTLPSNFWTQATQEDVNYVNTVHGEWVYIQYQLSSNLTSESVIVQPLKTQAQNKVIWPYMIGYVDNNLIYVTTDKTLDMIGRKKLVELPQVSSLSDPVKYDFLACDFENGSIEFWDKKTWVTSPNQKMMLCFDWVKKYFQPPQIFPENGILTIMEIDNVDRLVSHSSLRNQTNILFEGTNDNGFAFTTVMRFPYNPYGNRWQKKQYSMTFIEGYMTGLPVINYRVYLDVNGCHGVRTHQIDPIICLPPDRASLGKAPFGAHGLGNDPTDGVPYFQEIYKSPQNEFYFASIELSCETLDQEWSVLAVGLNAVNSNKNNSVLTGNKTIMLP